MTNEEAIGEMYYLTHKTDDKKALDALDMATKALEQQPCEDCVSRAEVYDIITRLFTSVEMTNEAWKEVMELVKELPSVKPKQKAGKWILKNDMYGMYQCSNCKEGWMNDYNYCPECGAKMEVEADAKEPKGDD